ncbi:MAG: hypothetical protein DME35_05490 [Verrucomicrobia bacterium]|nr:MAG: hypothetical protein DME35_05490 [Verrucomicrobiota bacterium]PYL28176.1 MAG: hypothetical protein DMF45_10045 [Verrucomicrobiota bacterium]
MRLPKIIALVSVIVFGAALTRSCYSIEAHDPNASSPGFYLLLIGPIGVLYGIYEWLANPVLLAAWIFSFLGKNKIALLLGIAASALMAAFLFRHTIMASEAPTYAKVTGYAAGYWLWLTSAVLMIVGAAVGMLKS